MEASVAVGEEPTKQSRRLHLRISQNRCFEVCVDALSQCALRETSDRGVFHNYHKASHVCFDLTLHDDDDTTDRLVTDCGVLFEAVVRYAPLDMAWTGTAPPKPSEAAGHTTQPTTRGAAATGGTVNYGALPEDAAAASEYCKPEILDVRVESDVVFEQPDAAAASSSSSSSHSTSNASAGKGAEEAQGRARFYISKTGRSTLRVRLNQLTSAHNGRLFQVVVRPAADQLGGVPPAVNSVVSEPVKVKARNVPSKASRQGAPPPPSFFLCPRVS
jgi:hypothetical protein